MTSANCVHQQSGPWITDRCPELLALRSTGTSVLLCPPRQAERKHQVAGWALLTSGCQLRKDDRERTTQCLTPVPAPRAPNTQVPGCPHPSDPREAGWSPSAYLAPGDLQPQSLSKEKFEEVLWRFFTNQGMAGQTCSDASRSRSATGGGDPQLEKFRAGVKPSPSRS